MSEVPKIKFPPHDVFPLDCTAFIACIQSHSALLLFLPVVGYFDNAPFDKEFRQTQKQLIALVCDLSCVCRTPDQVTVDQVIFNRKQLNVVVVDDSPIDT